MPALLSFTESQALESLRSFLLPIVSSAQFIGSISQNVLTITQIIQGSIGLGQAIQDSNNLILPGTIISGYISGTGGTGTYAINLSQTINEELIFSSLEILKGQINRVPEPISSDFIIMTPIRQARLSTNDTTYVDNIFTGSISGTTLTITKIIQNEGSFLTGMILLDETNLIAPGTFLGNPINLNPDGTGTYNVYPAQNLVSETVYAGLRQDLVPTQLTIQIDIHGPNSGDNAKIIEGLFRSDYAFDIIESGNFAIAPLYSSDARQVPFINAEQQYEYRWSLDLELQIDPIISTPEQFADKLTTTSIPANIVYLP